jgi:hypothetical protein
LLRHGVVVGDVDIALTDIGAKQPLYGETVAWSGSYFEKKENRPANFYCKELRLSSETPFNQIQLPDWPMLALLGVSLRSIAP